MSRSYDPPFDSWVLEGLWLGRLVHVLCKSIDTKGFASRMVAAKLQFWLLCADSAKDNGRPDDPRVLVLVEYCGASGSALALFRFSN